MEEYISINPKKNKKIKEEEPIEEEVVVKEKKTKKSKKNKTEEEPIEEEEVVVKEKKSKKKKIKKEVEMEEEEEQIEQDQQEDQQEEEQEQEQENENEENDQENEDKQKLKDLNKRKKQKQREKQKAKKHKEREEKVQAEIKETQKEKEPEDIRQVFISGLPYEANEQEVQDFFSGLSIENIKLPRFQDTGRLLGYGHVIFNSCSEKEEGLLRDKQKLGGRWLSVQRAKGEKIVQRVKVSPPSECSRAFVKNLSYETTEDQLGNLFRPCGQIDNIRIARHHGTNNSKGFAYIDFTSHSALLKALQSDNTLFQNRRITVDFDTGAMKQGFRLNVNGTGNTTYNAQVQEIKKKITKRTTKEQEVKKIKNLSRHS